MFTKDLRFVTHETIFYLVADIPNYGRWLPNSSACGGTVDVAAYPVRLGTSYLDAGPIAKSVSVTRIRSPEAYFLSRMRGERHSNGLGGLQEVKSVFHRSPPCKETKQSTLQM